MELFEDGTYRPISVMFTTPIYGQICENIWHMSSYKYEVAVVNELLRLQKENQLMCDVTPEDMTQHIQERSKKSLRVQLLDFQLEAYDEDEDDEVKLLLNMAREVNNSMRRRDIQLDAQRLLSAPELMPPEFRFEKITNKAKVFWDMLTERPQKASSSERLQQPRDVVWEVVPKVLQGLWVPKLRLVLTMPSQKLHKMAVGVTKAVEDRVLTSLCSSVQINISRSARDELIASIIATVHEAYPEEIRRKMLNTFSHQLLHHVTQVIAQHITALFQPKQEDNVSVESDTDAGASQEMTQSMDIVNIGL